MRLSTPEFATAEFVPAGSAHEVVPPQRSSVAAALALPSGRIGLVLTALTLAVALMAPAIATVDPFALTGAPLTAPSWMHLMGTDALGRDLFSGVLHGARTSLFVAGAVTMLTFICGACVGLIAGYRGGLVDDLLMRLTEMFQVLPRFFLVIVAIALFGAGLDRIVLVLGLTSWPVLARVIRAEVHSLRHVEFVRAAESSGASAVQVLLQELMPNVLPAVAVMLGLVFGQVLLVEASLGFLGLGDPNALSWGLLAGQAQGFLRVAWWLAFFPGLAIMVAVLGANLLADAFATSLSGR